MFLSRAAKRACCLDSRLLPPTFLLPFTAQLSSISHTTDSSTPQVLLNSTAQVDSSTDSPSASSTSPLSTTYAPQSAPLPPTPSSQLPPALSDSVRELLPVLRAQGPHYITAHIYDRPYLLTEGDTLRVPFLIHGVQPGDILRLTHASSLGSRDLTLKAGALSTKSSPRSPTASTISVVDPTPGSILTTESRKMPDGNHFVPHLAKGKHIYLDDRLFVCRATVMGTEAEPMRIKEKTKRRQRKVKTVKSKHRFTVLKIKELRIKDLDEIETNDA
jgi:large subunit ribosomal protein L21